MNISQGLKFKKFDLHIHTPASEDYVDKDATPKDIVNTALDRGLAGIAITDHQTEKWIDRIQATSEETNLVVFPGAELLVTGGERGVHVLVLFDTDKNGKHVEQFLNTIGIYSKDGKKTIAADVTVGQVADELEKYDPSAVLILAHCHSSKGVTGDIKGETRTRIFEPRRKCLLGAEANSSDFLNDKKKESHTRVVDCFDGTNPNYHKRKLGVYQCSDAHSLADIGKEFTYFKVDDEITIEDIRQCLIDRDTRIRQSFEYKEIIYPRIDSLKITSGFLADQEFPFHEGLNSILGGKGSGKSLAVEFLRFALNQEPSDSEINDDHQSKLEKCLKLHGEIEVSLTDESGKQYLIKRAYNPAEGNPIEIIDISDDRERHFQIEQVFPILFISQNEIIKIAEDRSGSNLREFIDRFFDFYKYQEEIERSKEELIEIDSRFSDILRAHLKSQNLQKEISTCKEEIGKIGRQIKNKVFEEYSKKEKIGQAIKNNIDFLDSLKDSLVGFENEHKDLTPPPILDTAVESTPSVKRSIDLTNEVINEIEASAKSLIATLDKKKKLIEQEHDDWKSGFASTKLQYDNIVKETGGTQIALDQKRKKLVNELSTIEKLLTRHQGRAKQMRNFAETRSAVIDKLQTAYKAYSEERKHRCNYFTNNSGGSLQVKIKEQKDKTAFKNNLIQVKRGTWLKDEDIELIANSISPVEFVNDLFRYEWSLRGKQEPLEKIAKTTKIPIDKVEKLAHHLLDEYEYKEILALLYNSVPQDVPTISYKVGDEFKELHDLSVGQKAVALLIIALSDGNFPIVIDQPEDSLDLRSIWEDLCSKLRGAKDSRQFIFTTHNSSVAVASDTDKFTILQADASHGKILYSGSMNREDIKKEVIDYLEGGHDTYSKKRQKYNL